MTADQRRGVWISIAARCHLALPGAAAHPADAAATPDACFPISPIVPCWFTILPFAQSAGHLGDIFLAIDRPDMRGVSIAIGASDPKLLLVRIDPLPQLFADRELLQTGLALDAHEIDGKPQNLNVGSISFRGSLNGSGK